MTGTKRIASVEFLGATKGCGWGRGAGEGGRVGGDGPGGWRVGGPQGKPQALSIFAHDFCPQWIGHGWPCE